MLNHARLDATRTWCGISSEGTVVVDIWAATSCSACIEAGELFDHHVERRKLSLLLPASRDPDDVEK